MSITEVQDSARTLFKDSNDCYPETPCAELERVIPLADKIFKRLQTKFPSYESPQSTGWDNFCHNLWNKVRKLFGISPVLDDYEMVQKLKAEAPNVLEKIEYAMAMHLAITALDDTSMAFLYNYLWGESLQKSIDLGNFDHETAACIERIFLNAVEHTFPMNLVTKPTPWDPNITIIFPDKPPRLKPLNLHVTSFPNLDAN